MLKLKNKYGFTIVEVTCSIAIFCLLFLSAVSILIKSFQIQTYNIDNEKYEYTMELLKNKIQYDCSYDEIKKLPLASHYYISKEKLESNTIIESNFCDLISYTKPEEFPYAVVDIKKDLVFNIEISLNTKTLNRDRKSVV